MWNNVFIFILEGILSFLWLMIIRMLIITAVYSTYYVFCLIAIQC